METDSDRLVGWIVSYIIHVRGGGPPSGYVSSGFFGGEPRPVLGLDLPTHQSMGILRSDTWPCHPSMGQQKGTIFPSLMFA